MELQPNIPTSNSFALLTNAPDKIADPPRKDPQQKVPPIILDGVPINTTEFINEMKNLVKSNFLLKYRPKSTQILPKTKEDHIIICENLRLKSIPFHTYGFKEDRHHKFVIHGLPATFTEEEIKQDLLLKQNGIQHVQQFSRSDENGQKTRLPVFAVITAPNITLQSLRSITSILYHKVSFEKYQPADQITMCYRCQRFNHSSRNCNLKPRCVRCGKEHDAKECDRVNNPVKCANCGKSHVASYRGCEERLNQTARRQNQHTNFTSSNKGAINQNRYYPLRDSVNGPSFATVLTGRKGPTDNPTPFPPAGSAYPNLPLPATHYRQPENVELQKTLSFISEAKEILQELQDMGIPQMIKEFRKMVSELKTASTNLDKLTIMSNYSHLLNATP